MQVIRRHPFVWLSCRVSDQHPMLQRHCKVALWQPCARRSGDEQACLDPVRPIAPASVRAPDPADRLWAMIQDGDETADLQVLDTPFAHSGDDRGSW